MAKKEGKPEVIDLLSSDDENDDEKPVAKKPTTAFLIVDDEEGEEEDNKMEQEGPMKVGPVTTPPVAEVKKSAAERLDIRIERVRGEYNKLVAMFEKRVSAKGDLQKTKLLTKLAVLQVNLVDIIADAEGKKTKDIVTDAVRQKVRDYQVDINKLKKLIEKSEDASAPAKTTGKKRKADEELIDETPRKKTRKEKEEKPTEEDKQKLPPRQRKKKAPVGDVSSPEEEKDRMDGAEATYAQIKAMLVNPSGGTMGDLKDFIIEQDQARAAAITLPVHRDMLGIVSTSSIVRGVNWAEVYKLLLDADEDCAGFGKFIQSLGDSTLNNYIVSSSAVPALYYKQLYNGLAKLVTDVDAEEKKVDAMDLSARATVLGACEDMKDMKVAGRNVKVISGGLVVDRTVRDVLALSIINQYLMHVYNVLRYAQLRNITDFAEAEDQAVDDLLIAMVTSLEVVAAKGGASVTGSTEFNISAIAQAAWKQGDTKLDGFFLPPQLWHWRGYQYKYIREQVSAVSFQSTVQDTKAAAKRLFDALPLVGKLETGFNISLKLVIDGKGFILPAVMFDQAFLSDVITDGVASLELRNLGLTGFVHHLNSTLFRGDKPSLLLENTSFAAIPAPWNSEFKMSSTKSIVLRNLENITVERPIDAPRTEMVLAVFALETVTINIVDVDDSLKSKWDKGAALLFAHRSDLAKPPSKKKSDTEQKSPDISVPADPEPRKVFKVRVAVEESNVGLFSAFKDRTAGQFEKFDVTVEMVGPPVKKTTGKKRTRIPEKERDAAWTARAKTMQEVIEKYEEEKGLTMTRPIKIPVLPPLNKKVGNWKDDLENFVKESWDTRYAAFQEDTDGWLAETQADGDVDIDKLNIENTRERVGIPAQASDVDSLPAWANIQVEGYEEAAKDFSWLKYHRLLQSVSRVLTNTDTLAVPNPRDPNDQDEFILSTPQGFSIFSEWDDTEESPPVGFLRVYDSTKKQLVFLADLTDARQATAPMDNWLTRLFGKDSVIGLETTPLPPLALKGLHGIGFVLPAQLFDEANLSEQINEEKKTDKGEVLRVFPADTETTERGTFFHSSLNLRIDAASVPLVLFSKEFLDSVGGELFIQRAPTSNAPDLDGKNLHRVQYDIHYKDRLVGTKKAIHLLSVWAVGTAKPGNEGEVETWAFYLACPMDSLLILLGAAVARSTLYTTAQKTTMRAVDLLEALPVYKIADYENFGMSVLEESGIGLKDVPRNLAAYAPSEPDNRTMYMTNDNVSRLLAIAIQASVFSEHLLEKDKGKEKILQVVEALASPAEDKLSMLSLSTLRVLPGSVVPIVRSIGFFFSGISLPHGFDRSSLIAHMPYTKENGEVALHGELTEADLRQPITSGLVLPWALARNGSMFLATSFFAMEALSKHLNGIPGVVPILQTPDIRKKDFGATEKMFADRMYEKLRDLVMPKFFVHHVPFDTIDIGMEYSPYEYAIYSTRSLFYGVNDTIPWEMVTDQSSEQDADTTTGPDSSRFSIALLDLNKLLNTLAGMINAYRTTMDKMRSAMRGGQEGKKKIIEQTAQKTMEAYAKADILYTRMNETLRATTSFVSGITNAQKKRSKKMGLSAIEDTGLDIPLAEFAEYYAKRLALTRISPGKTPPTTAESILSYHAVIIELMGLIQKHVNNLDEIDKKNKEGGPRKGSTEDDSDDDEEGGEDGDEEDEEKETEKNKVLTDEKVLTKKGDKVADDEEIKFEQYINKLLEMAKKGKVADMVRSALKEARSLLRSLADRARNELGINIPKKDDEEKEKEEDEETKQLMTPDEEDAIDFDD